MSCSVITDAKPYTRPSLRWLSGPRLTLKVTPPRGRLSHAALPIANTANEKSKACIKMMGYRSERYVISRCLTSIRPQVVESGNGHRYSKFEEICREWAGIASDGWAG